jgi:hypothetical protein
MLQWVEGTDTAAWTIDDQLFTVGSAEFQCTYAPTSREGRYHIRKPPALVEAYARLLEGFRGGTIVELGTGEGGGLVLTSLLAEPACLIGIELDPAPRVAVDAFSASSDAPGRPRPYYGVDQADTEHVARVLDAELGDRPVDLVIDDASHLLGPTRASFDHLFPRLRPGGLYVLEDWNWEHLRASRQIAALEDGSATHSAAFAAHFREALTDPASPWHERARAELAQRTGAPLERGSLPAEPPPDIAAAAPVRPRVTERPLSDLVMQLVLARATSGQAVAGLTVSDRWTLVERGPAVLDPRTFRLADQYEDHYAQLH